MAEAEAAQGQTSINQQVVTIAVETVLVAAWRQRQPWQCGSGNGDGSNGGDNVAAMAAVMAAPAWSRQWQRGRPMWGEVIFHSTYYYLHNSTYRSNNNCQAYDKTLSVLIQSTKCFDSKHFVF
jgi:hypothetical protein